MKVSIKVSSAHYNMLTEGQRIIPTGPSPRWKGNLASSSIASIINGKQKVSVFPDPVNAMPIISRPENAVGRPCI